MKDELPEVPEHALCVVPETVETQDFAIMVKELLQCVVPLVWPKWLHTFLNLDEGPCEIQRINISYHTFRKGIK